MKVAVIGGGWYGCHLALELRKLGLSVTLYESNSNIFQGISGTFGIRLHAGPHYPRSEKTRKNCRDGFAEFVKAYPELVIKHAYSLYGLGELDAIGEPSKVDVETFRAVGRECSVGAREINPSEWGYTHLLTAFDIDEPSMLLGNQLRKKFRGYLEAAGVEIICDFHVGELSREGDRTVVRGVRGECAGIFDYVVNTTSFKSLLPSPTSGLPFDVNIVYQPCLALVYEDRLSKVNALPPFSFIVMDGWYPCMMPWVENNEDRESFRKYVVTHGSYTIMGSFATAEEANASLEEVVNETFVKTEIKPRCEAEMRRFWPPFFATTSGSSTSTEPRFKYVGYKAAVLAKIKSNREFRSAITFASQENGVIYIVPGKVSNIFDAAREAIALINGGENVLREKNYLYVKGGSLHEGVAEFREPISFRNTGDLQTLKELQAERLKALQAEAPETSPDDDTDCDDKVAVFSTARKTGFPTSSLSTRTTSSSSDPMSVCSRSSSPPRHIDFQAAMLEHAEHSDEHPSDQEAEAPAYPTVASLIGKFDSPVLTRVSSPKLPGEPSHLEQVTTPLATRT